MATAPALLSIDEYLRTSYHPDVHFVDGGLEERNVGEYSHAKIQGFITALFLANEERWGTDSVVEQRIRVNSSRVRVADVAVLAPEAPLEEVIQTPPLLCVEVLSPEDRLARAELVLADYRNMGVPNIWLIDPIRRIAYTFGEAGMSLVFETQLTVPGTPIVLDLPALFAKLDAAIARRGRTY